MPDYDGGREAFREAVRAAEAAAEAEAAPQETPSEPAVEPALPEVPEGEPAQAPAAEPAVELPADTSTPEMTPEQQRIAELEARLAEKDAFIGRQSSEVGELRQSVTQLQEQFSQQQQQPAAVPQVPQVPITQEMILEDPARATQIAFEQRNEQALAMAWESWKDEDPASASLWLSDRRWEQREAALREEFAQTRQQVEQSAQAQQEAAAQAAEQQAWAQAFDTMKAADPAFMANAERLLTDVAPQHLNPDLLQALATGNAETKVSLLKAVVAFDRANADPAAVRQQLETEAQAAAQEAAVAVAAAGAVSGQGTVNNAEPEPELTPEQLEQRAYLARIERRNSFDRNWTGRAGQ